MNDTMFVGVETIEADFGASRLYGASGTTLAQAQLDTIGYHAIQAIMSDDVQALRFRVQFKDARALGPGEMHGLRGDDLQHFVQVER